MKITIVLGAFFPVPPRMGGGVEKVWFTLAPEFAKRGHDVVTLSRKIPELPDQETIDGVKHLRVGGFDTPPSLVWLKFLDLIYSTRAISILPAADIIVTNTFWLPLLLRDVTRGQIYVHVGRQPKGQMRFYRRAARLQAPSSAIADQILKQVPQLADKVITIPYPITTVVQSPSPFSEREKIILFVGRVHPEKGVHVLVEAFVKGARTALTEWKLMIVGPVETKLGGGGESYRNLLEHLAGDARDRISFAGPVFDSVKLAERYRRTPLFIYPSLSERGETFGLAPLEAMAHGCAVIVSNLDCFRDFICDGESGFVFEHRAPQIVEALQAKIESVIKNQSTLERVAGAGHEKSREYSPERIAEHFLEDFSSLVRTHGGNPNR